MTYICFMATTARARIFMTGRSQAVRIPKEFRFAGTEVEIYREGDRIVLAPIRDAWSSALLEMLARPAEPLERPVRSTSRRIVVLD